jgi:tetratricopeptide (TPR) repeat protein
MPAKTMKYASTVIGCFCVVAAAAQTMDSAWVARLQVMQRSDSLMSNYQFEKALNLLTTLNDSLDINLLLRIGQCNFRLGLSRGAIHPYERVLEMDSTNLIALNQLGQLFARDGDFSKALYCYLRLVDLDSTNSYYYKQSALMAVKAKDLMMVPGAKDLMAISLYEKALHYNPSDAEASLALGNLLMEREEFDRVDSVVQNALARDPGHKPLIVLKAKSAFEQQRYHDVIAMVNTLLETTDTAAVHARLLGASYFQLHDYRSVIVCMNYFLNNNYDSDWIYYYLGVATRELGDIPASIAYFRKAVEKSISENTGTYYSQLGRSFEELKDYQSAIRAYRAAYNNSKEGILLYHLARSYDVYYKDKAQALAYYKKYLESDDTIRLAKEYSRRRIQAIGQ